MRLGAGVVLALSMAAAAVAACGSDTTSGLVPGASGGGGSATSSGDGGSSDGGGIFAGTGVGGSVTAGLDVTPAAPQTITVAAGDMMPTLVYDATLDGTPVSAGWGVDRGEIGTVQSGPTASTVFTPTGKAGGLVTIVAGANDQTVERQVMVNLTAAQNGPDMNHPGEAAQIAGSVADLTAGGGIGGVGGEGLGEAVTDQATLDALASPAETGQTEGLTLLYPYDATIWPRGLLAPLLQWKWSIGDADAVKITLRTTSGSFVYEGTFGRPAILAQTSGNFVRHPIPQGAWEMATNTAGSAALDGTVDDLVMELTVAKDGVGYGPITRNWKVAPGRLSGTIYYNSYGTQLAKNYTGAVGGDNQFGGAVLSIKVGDTAPQLAAGATGASSECRVCHSVSADGSRLTAQHGVATTVTSAYAITPMGITEEQINTSAEFPAITPDGNTALNGAGQLLDLNDTGNTLAVAGIDAVTTDLGTPAFSPDGTKVVFNPMTGPIADPTQKLVVMDYDSMVTFSNPVTVADLTGSPAETRPGWGAFFPDNASVVFQQQIAAGVDGNNHGDMRTRKGAKAFLAWAPADGSAAPTPLDQLNGTGYLPQLDAPINMSCTGDGAEVGNIDADHGDDANTNYEPTVNPVATGGYAWVVVTSRRMYGNVATIPPYCSDPRGVDLIQNITPKKLWVAAVDLNATPGTDPSHPAFYLPAQELLAGNARGFWVLDPCKSDGEDCESGDQCCNGFCSPSGDDPGDPLVCSPPPEGGCSKVQEKCDTSADCCDPSALCINGFCALPPPQ